MLVTPRDLRVDTLLTNILVGFVQQSYINDRVFPVVGVNEQTGLIPRFKRSHWYRNSAHKRAPGTASRGGSWDVDTNLPYNAERISFRDELPDDYVRNAADVYQVEQTSVGFVRNMIELRKEIDLAEAIFTTSVWADDENGAGNADFTQWSSLASSNPLIDIATYEDEIETRIGTEGRTLLMGKQVWNSLRWNPVMLDAIKWTQRGVLTLDLVASLLDVDEIIVGRSMKTDSPEGTAEASVTYDRIWGKHALLYYKTNAPAINSPAAGYTLTWNVIPNSYMYIKRMRNEEKEIDIIEGNAYFDHVVTSPLAGTFLQNAVA